MRLWRRWSDWRSREGLTGDGGSAAVEFVFVGLLLLVPVVYLIVAVGAIQGQSFGVQAGARHIARAVATASDSEDAERRADAVLASIVAEYELGPESVEVTLDCLGDTAPCPSAGATVVVSVATAVRLPLVPPVLGLERLAVVPVEASAGQRISRGWGG